MIALAIDVGASGGRAVVGRWENRRLVVREVYRFPNEPIRAAGRLHWDIRRLQREIEQSIAAARATGLGTVRSLGIDAWGLDFGLLDAAGELLANPCHYRDALCHGAMEEVWTIVPREEIFARTGIQFLPFNSLYQLYALARADAPLLARAATLLMIPDLLRYFLTGERSCEYTDASTTQFLALAGDDWDRSLLTRLGLPTQLLTPLVSPASPAGRLRREIGEATGAGAIEVVAVAEHDTASAVAAVPATGEFAYLSCGTWSLLGTEVARPIVDERALAWNFTNEGGMAGTFRLLKNIMGLWLIEGCRRAWAGDGHRLSYEQMAAATAAGPAFAALVDPDDPRFLDPPHMVRAVQDYCRATGQAVPDSPAAILRCLHESLALKYRLVLERVEALTGRRFPGLHIVGGGTRNRQLLQFTADAIARPVWAGPAEATAVGNLLAQLLAAGQIGSLAEGRALVRESFPLATVEPRRDPAWDEAYRRFLALIADRGE